MLAQIENSIKWLNDNNGAVMALLTATMALMMFVYVFATLRIVKLSQKSMKQANLIEKSRVRPYVTFDIVVEPKYRSFYAVLRNSGISAACDVEISINPPISREMQNEDWGISFVENRIPFLAPDRELKDFIDVTHQFLSGDEERKYDVTVSYSDREGELYEERAVISLEHHRKAMSIGNENELKDIAKYLKELLATEKNRLSVENRNLRLQDRLVSATQPSGPSQKVTLTEEEMNYLLSISEPQNGGQIYYSQAAVSIGVESEKYRTMRERLVQAGYLREEVDFWTLTEEGWAKCEALRGKNSPEGA